MYLDKECKKCGNKNWAVIWEDNFICQKCRQKREREAKERAAEQKKN